MIAAVQFFFNQLLLKKPSLSSAIRRRHTKVAGVSGKLVQRRAESCMSLKLLALTQLCSYLDLDGFESSLKPHSLCFHLPQEKQCHSLLLQLDVTVQSHP